MSGHFDGKELEVFFFKDHILLSSRLKYNYILSRNYLNMCAYLEQKSIFSMLQNFKSIPRNLMTYFFLIDGRIRTVDNSVLGIKSVLSKFSIIIFLGTLVPSSQIFTEP